MQNYQREFLDFAVHTGVLCFGEYTLKSGRLSPYFFNSGLFNTGEGLARLGRYYAQAILDSGIEFDMIFGPAYKGIPLVSAASIALSDYHGRSVPYAFNRKEAKHHGERGTIVGAPLVGRVLIVDDVISAGTSVGESVQLIEDAAAIPIGVIIALDRQERGRAELSAIQEVAAGYNMQVASIVRLAELIEYLEEQPGMKETLNRLLEYQRRYGVVEPIS